MRGLAIILAVLLQAVPSPSAGTRTWELSSYGDFLAGTFENAALDRQGFLHVAPSLDVLHESDQSVVWAIARAPDGVVYCGTGHQGAVFKVTPGGEGELLWNAPQIEVFALAIGPDGKVYAGTSPDGKVYRIAPDGEAHEFFDPGEKYIWSLIFDSQDRLIAATGDAGKVYRIAPDGTGEVWFESGQRHVMSLALDSAGRVLVGTDPEGILYRVEDDGTAFALHDSDLPEVRSIDVGSDGSVHFAAMGGGMDRLLQAIPMQQGAVQVQVAGAAAPTASAPQVSSRVTYAQPQVVYSGERSALYRLRPGQAVEKLWGANDENILGLVTTDGAPVGALFATDQEGRVYEIGADRKLSLLSQTGKAQLTVMLRVPDGILIGSAHGGALYRMSTALAASGTYTSAPQNTSGVSQWGRLSWRGNETDDGSIQITTRSGNTYRPDTSWSAWSAPLSDNSGSLIESPAARFLQWRATLRGEARLDAVRVHYLPQNSVPVVHSVNVVPETAKPASSTASQGATTSSSYSITVSASGTSSAPKAKPAGQESTATAVRKLAIVWNAEDPDGDTLRVSIDFRGEGESDWKNIRDDLSGARYSIESDSLADGMYEFRVRVDDGASNAPGRVLSASRVSRPVLVDQTPPRIRTLPAATEGELRFEAVDDASEILSAEYAVDAGKWVPVLPADGIPDSLQEVFVVKPEGLDEGEHLVVLRVRDRLGNAALAKSLLR